MDTHCRDGRDPFARVYDAEDDDFGGGFPDQDPHDDDFGCLFPGECCMPELHFASECHTAEMAEEMHGYAALADPEEDHSPPGQDHGALPDDGVPF